MSGYWEGRKNQGSFVYEKKSKLYRDIFLKQHFSDILR